MLCASACSSSFADEFADAEGFGWAPTAPPPDVKKLIARKVRRGGARQPTWVLGSPFAPSRCARHFQGATLLDRLPCTPGRRKHCSVHIMYRAHHKQGKTTRPYFNCTHLVVPFRCTQAKEIERLNGVYNQILSKAGVEIIGADGGPPALPAPMPAASLPAASCLQRLASASVAPCPPALGPSWVHFRQSWAAGSLHNRIPTCHPCLLSVVVPTEGRGVVLDPHTVEVRATDGSVRQLKTKNILVATGGRAVKPKIPGAVGAGPARPFFCTSERACRVGR